MKNEFTDIMVDIETMSTDSNAAICSVAAVEFNLNTGKTRKEFYEKCTLQSALNIGLTVKAETIEWWSTQDEETRKELFNTDQTIIAMLCKFTTWVDSLIHSNYRFWGNSARFDLGILEDAYKKVNLRIPWNFRNERDVRTLVDFNPAIKKNLPFVGVKHNPLADCYHQILYCSKIYQSIMPQPELALKPAES